MSDEIKELKDSEKSATLVLEPQEPHSTTTVGDEKSEHGSSSWIAGVVLILVGAAFLVANFTDYQLHNWWALFILIPAVSSLGNAVRIYRRDERLGKEGRGSLVSGLIFLFVSAAFLLGWDWSAIWPFFLIIGGAGLLISAFLD